MRNSNRILSKFDAVIESRLFVFVYFLCLPLVALSAKIIALYVIWKNEELALAPDSNQYLILSENLDWYFSSSVSGIRTLSLLRPIGYPAFIALLDQSIFYIVLVQFVLYIVLLIDIYRVIHNRFGKEISKFLLPLIIIEPALTNSIFLVYADFLFAFSVWASCRIVLLKDFRILNVAISCLGSILCITLKPVSIVLLLALLMVFLLDSQIRKVISLLVILMLVTFSIQLTLNYQKTDRIILSSIQSHNLLFYEAAGAKSLETGKPLEIVQDALQRELENNIGSLYVYGQEGNKINLVDKNRIELAREILVDYPKGLIELHLRGIPKLFLSIGERDIFRIYSKVVESSVYHNALVAWSVVLYMIQGVMFCLFCAGMYLSRKSWRHLSIVYLVPLLFAAFTSGAQAYSRFRVPFAIFIAIGAVFAIEKVIISRESSERKGKVSLKL